ncbi:MAG: flagellar motor switch protein FliM [Actinomycetota bacterium]|nr:flagellar motor switch protein FliM [Actinomycetota bacterium]
MTVAKPAAAPTRPGRGRVNRRTRGEGPKLYDFRRPTKLSREHTRALQIVFETYAKQATTVLTTSLRAVAQVNLASIEQLTYDEYVGMLSNPTLMCLLSAEPLAGAGVFEMSGPIAMTVVDHLLGGPGSESQPQRVLTEIEYSLVRGVIERLLGELRYAFEPIVRIDPQIVGIEYNPQFAQVASAADMVLVASFDLRVGSQECLATIMLSFNAVHARLEAMSGQIVASARERRAREAAAEAMADRIQDVHVGVAVEFAPVMVRPSELLCLEVGDVLPLGHKTSRPLAVRAADVTFAHGVAGSQGKRLACLVVESPADDSPSHRQEHA